MDKLLKQQQELVEQMAKFKLNVGKQPIAKRSKNYYTGRITGWNDLWVQFRTNHMAIIDVKTDEDKIRKYFANEVFADTEQTFYDFNGDLQDLLDQYKKPGDAEKNNGDLQGKPVSSFIKLPPADLPKFSGDYAKWISFRDRFSSIINNAGEVSGIQKLDFLMSHLEGEALKLVEHIPIEEDNFAVVWDALKKRFENKKLLVNAQLKILFGQPIISQETSQQIKRILDTTNQCIENLKHLAVDTANWDPILIFLIVQRLPQETFVQWEQQQDSTRLPTYSSLVTFLENRFQTLEAISQSKNTTREKSCLNDSQGKGSLQTYLVNSAASCPMCSKSHYLGKCYKFKKLTVKERENIVRQNSLCFNCFARSHIVKKCTSSARCFECKKKHNTLLHVSAENKTNNSNTNNSSVPVDAKGNFSNVSSSSCLSPDTPEFELNSNFAVKNCRVLLATAKINLCGQDGRIWPVRALIDPGSQGSFITENLVQKAGLKKLHTRVVITGVGITETGRSQSTVNAMIKSNFFPQIVLETSAVVLKKLTNLLPSCPITVENCTNLSKLQLADPNYSTPGSIDMLLGADVYPKIILEGIQKLGIGCPVAQNTVFGWVLSGPVNGSNAGSPVIQNFFNQMELDNFLKRFWEIEEISKPIPKSKEHEWCERFYQDTHKRQKDGKYCVRLPFLNIEDGPIFGNSKNLALKRLEHIERRLQKDEKLYKEYKSCIEEYEALGHMKRISIENAELGSHYVIPHHAVIKETSTSTKLRVVFDASCKTSNGKSLNDQIHIGPRLQPDITSILTRWRCYKYVFCTDVEKMYRQIWVHPDDTKFQRILWRNEHGVADIFELLTVTFGLACAPWLAIRTLNQLQEDEGKNYPNAAHVIRDNVYVDDVMTGSFSLDETLTMRKELQQMFESGGFKLRKWASNCHEVLNGIPESDRIIEFIPKIEDQETIKTLGVFWSPQSDEFMFKVNNIPFIENISKRQVLSWLARIYDPLGWVAPVLIVAKILIQSLWQEGLCWDDKIGEKNEKQWNNFAQQLEELKKIRIPRWIGISSNKTTIELHGFSDASEVAYGAVIYSRIISDNGHVEINLIMAKTKVAPLKTVRLPRLELCAALLLGKLFASVQENFITKVEKWYAWTDSEIALSWIKSSPSRWPTFVANRVADIHDLTGPGPWRYIPTSDNPADCCSRGLNPNFLVDFQLWWNGPKWLKQNEEYWPPQKLPSVKAEDLEYKKIKTFATKVDIIDEDTIMNKFSDLTKLIRISSWCVKFVQNCKAGKSGEPRTSSNITAAEYRETLRRLIRITQSCFFHEEIFILKGKEVKSKTIQDKKMNYQISRESPIYSLLPFLDEHQILRVRGRIGKSGFPYTERFPIILPYRSKLTRLIIINAHQSTLHGGMSETLAYLRRRFWIVKARIAVKYEINQCVICVRLKKETRSQLMGDLPRCRLDVHPPFTNVGVDYAGPILTRPSKIRGRASTTLKGYISVFICMTTKAIHIEFVSDLTTDAFLAAFRRFISRRGLCTNVYSDGGTNFQGASNVFENEVKQVLYQNSKIDSSLTSMGIQWHFIPPGAPHFGGIWEAAVKSIKNHMRRILGNHVLTYEEMTTMLTQIEACLNSRPLYPMSDDPNDLEVLTPGHFLIGRALMAPPQTDWTEVNINLLSRWNLIQKFQQDFWNSWRSEYMSRLQQRPKWLKPEKNIEKENLVLIKDERLPPLHWRLGRVIEVHPGSDGLVRVVTLKTQQGEIKRPITKICVLPVMQQTEAQ